MTTSILCTYYYTGCRHHQPVGMTCMLTDSSPANLMTVYVYMKNIEQLSIKNSSLYKYSSLYI